MGNQIIGKRPKDFYKGFTQPQLEYLKDKFQILKDDQGFLSKQKIIDAYKCNEQIAIKTLKFIDFTENGTIDQYQFICAVAAFCNATITRLGQILFQIITDKKKKLDVKSLQGFTDVALKYNAFISNQKIPSSRKIELQNKKKFKKYDYDRSEQIDKEQFIKMCLKDQDYKKWMINMGFISKKQYNNQQQIFQDIDSDIQNQIGKHNYQVDQDVDNLKKGIQHRIGAYQAQFQQVQEQGQQSTPMTSWKDTVKNMISKQQLKNAPSQNLSIEYVYGYRSFDCRNNLKYNTKNKIVYHQAALGIVLDGKQNKQDFMQYHNDDITCLDIIQDIVVTGQMGKKPTIVIWNSQKTLEGELPVQYILTEGLQNSIGNVCISQSKKLVAANCNNQDHNIVIYDLSLIKQKDLTSMSSIVIAQGKGTKSVILDIKFSKDEKTLIVATVRQILFFTFQNKLLKSNRGIFNQFSPSSGLSLAVIENKTFTGMANGSIYIWQKQKCKKSLEGHQSAVTAITNRTDKKSIVSGDKDGVIIIWNQSYQIERTIKISSNISLVSKIISLFMSKSNNLLVGTKGGDILEYRTNQSEPKKLMCSHYEKQLWALAVHPSQGVFYTGGEDKRLVKWKYFKQKKIQKMVVCKYMIRTIDVNENLKIIAVGYKNGLVQFFDIQNLEKKTNKKSITNFKNPDRQVLNIVKFDKDGKYLAICYTSPHSLIYLYDMIKQVKLAEVKTISRVINIDFSYDSKKIQFNTSSYEYLCYGLPKFEKVKPESVKDQQWATSTLTLSYATQGIFTSQVFQKDIHSCQSNGINTVVGDNFGKIKLFNYPVVNYPLYNKYKGHSSHITLVRFTKIQKYVISLGGFQKSIILWKYDDKTINNDFQQQKDNYQYIVQNQGQQADFQQTSLKEQKKKHLLKNQLAEQFQIVQQQGQEALAVKPFLGQIVSPSNFQVNYYKDNKLPQQSLKINHVFGIRNSYLKDQVRNQCKFTSDFKNIVYPTASLGIKQNIQKSQQKYFNVHKEDIVSFAVDSTRKIAATGQMAQKNALNPKKKIVSIYVWCIESQEVLQKLDGFHTIAVVLLEFSPDSKLLFSCGNDQKNSYAIYQWQSGVILYCGPVSRGKVNGISWKNNLEFATCGNDHIKFWSANKSRQGQITGSSQSMFSIISINGVYITGSGTGGLYVWIGQTSSQRINAHKGKVHTLKTDKNNINLFSGADDGQIKIWKTQKNGRISVFELYIDIRSAFLNQSIKKMNQNEFGIISIDVSANSQLLVVTKGCQIILVDKKKTCKSLNSGHYKQQLWGLSINSINDDLFVTSGDDNTIRLWSIKNKCQITRQYIQNGKLRGIDWSNDGDSIAVANQKAMIWIYDSKLKQKKQSAYQTIITRQKKINQIDPWVQQIKFSPNNKMIAIGSHGKSRNLQILNYESGIVSSKCVIKGKLTSALLHLDWNNNSEIFSTNSQSYQLQFFNAAGKTLFANQTKDEQWYTWTRKFGFPVQGIFQGVDYTDVNTVCADKNKKILAVGYDDQIIRLFKYPAYIPKQVSKQYYGHSSHITRLRFNNKYLISVGGNDRTIIIWDLIGQNNYGKLKQQQQDDEDQDINYEIDIPQKAIKVIQKKKKQNQQFQEVQQTGEQFLNVKPWLGAIKQPTYIYPKDKNANQPQVSIQLQHVYGYRSKDCRQNLFYYQNDKILYHAAAVVIFHNTNSNTQNLITQHNDDLLSIAFNRQKKLILSGQIGRKPIVCLIQQQKIKRKWIGPVSKGILCLAISPSGSRGVCVGMDDNHQIAILNLKKQNTIQYRVKGGRQIILKVEWVNQQQFVTVGIKHFKYWSIQNGNLTQKSGSLKKSFVSLAIKDDLILTGSQNSQLTKWKRNQVDTSLQLMDQKKKGKNQEENDIPSTIVQAISIQKSVILAGTKSKRIFIIDKIQFKILSIINLQDLFKANSNCPSVRSVCSNIDQTKILVGTLASEIFQLNLQKSLTKQKQKIKIIQTQNRVKGHYSPNNKWTNQVWGLCIDQQSDKFFTCSDDATLRCWDLKKRKLLSQASLNYGPVKKGQNPKPLQKDKKTNDYSDAAKGRVVALSPDKKILCVGCKNGVVRIYRFDDQSNQMKYVEMFRKANQQISDIKFVANTLVIGSHDNALYIYDYDQGNIKQKYKSFKKHSSYITHFDLSRDSCYLKSTCGAYQLLFWDLQSGKQLTSGATMLRDERWATWTTTLGWPVQGIWPKYSDGTFINSVDRSHMSVNGTTLKQQRESMSYYLLATGNDFGKVGIFNYPCLIKGSKSVQGKGHSSHVTNVRWSNDDKYIISTGGEDQCIMQWRVNKSIRRNKK